jgi:hypothetical protein
LDERDISAGQLKAVLEYIPERFFRYGPAITGDHWNLEKGGKMERLDCGKIAFACSPLKRVFVLSVCIMLMLMGISGCAVTGGPLIKASWEGNAAAVKDLLDKGADVNVRGGCGLWTPGGGTNATPLYCAALAGHMEVVRILVDRGADVNARNARALFAAVNARDPGIAKYLIEHGADMEYAMAQLAGGKNTKDDLAFLERVAEKQKTAASPERPAAGAYIGPDRAVKSDIDEPPAIKTRQNRNAYAIVIGIETYRQKLPRADFAVQDAKLVTEYLTKSLGYQAENVITLLNDRALKSDFEKYFEKWLGNVVEKGATVFVYYSGHGAPNPNTGDAYLVPYDGDPSFIDQTGYSLRRMYGALGRLPAKEIIVALDSCFSGAGGRSVIAKGSRPLVMNIEANVSLPKNMTVLSASSGIQTSSTYDEKGHGLFTYFMLKGIKNEDIVRPDGSIMTDDLFSYVKPQVERIARRQYNNEQTPQLFKSK